MRNRIMKTTRILPAFILLLTVACIGYQTHTGGSNTTTGFTTGYNCWTGHPFSVGWDDTFFFNVIKIYCY
jgi:hypothetical protein